MEPAGGRFLAHRIAPTMQSTHRRWKLRLLNLYPPYLGAGVRVKHIAPDLRTFEVEMKLRWWNRNYVGTHFGGSLYTMCDPFFMLILMEGLGGDFIVWDKSARIRFRRPGRGTVRATFHISEERIEAIRQQVLAQGKVEPTFEVEIRDEDGEVVAQVEKLLYVRAKEDSAKKK
jgi:acyl-coenzyme A thioesterase PaaI-like protein